MRTAKDIVADYRKRGYNDERIRALANNRPEPIRSEILSLLSTANDQIEAGSQEKENADIDVMADINAESNAHSSDGEPRSPNWKLDSDFVRQVHANLAPIQVEYLNADEFYTRQQGNTMAAPDNAQAISATAHSPDAVEGKNDAEAAAISVPAAAQMDMTAAKQGEGEGAAGEGELWPQPMANESDLMPPQAASMEGAYYACLESEKTVLDVEALCSSKAGQRSLDVIRQTLQDDPALAAAVQEVDNKIIVLSPPYAMEEISADDEESKLIEFPAEMIESYEAIRSAQGCLLYTSPSPRDS